MIPKLIRSGTFDFDAPVSKLVGAFSRGLDRDGLRKRAAMFDDRIKSFKPEKGYEYVHVITLGAGETYGCLGPDTSVLLDDGSHKNIVDVQVGDVVLSGNGNLKKVKTLFNRVVEDVIEVEVEGLPYPITMSTNHPVAAVKKESLSCPRDKYIRCFPASIGTRAICKRPRSSGCVGLFEEDIKAERLSAQELSEGDFLIFNQPLPIAPPRAVTVEEAELMGYWLAEGCFQRNAGNKQVASLRLSFNLHTEESLVDRVTELATSLGMHANRYPSPTKGEWVVTVTGNPTLVREWYSFFGSGAHNKKIPMWLLSLPRQHVLKLLQAYIEGDGSIDLSSRQVYAHTVSYDLAMGVQRLLWGVGVPASVCALGAGGYHISYKGRHVPTELAFGIEQEPDKHKIRIFSHRGQTYLPIRKISALAWKQPIYNIEVEDDHSYVSGGIFSFNSNSNADYFNKTAREYEIPHPEKGAPSRLALDGGLLKYHSTFTEGGHVYRHHQNNKDAKAALGKIAMECYNDKMDRGELILALPVDKWGATIEKIATEKPVYWSMGSVVPFDFCSECGHKRATRKESCDHILNHPLELTKEGHQIFAINDKPRFHDISEVFKPADKTAFALRRIEMLDKAASEKQIITSDVLAEIEGWRPPDLTLNGLTKRAARLKTLQKLAEIEAFMESPGMAALTGDVKHAFMVGSGRGDISQGDMAKLASDLGGSLSAMNDAKVILPLPEFMRLVMGKEAADNSSHIEGACGCMPGIFQQTLHGPDLDSILDDDSYDSDERITNPMAKDAAARLAPTHSLSETIVQRRMLANLGKPEQIKKPSMNKQAAEHPAAAYIAREYTKYMIAFSRGQDDFTRRMVVVQKSVN